MSNRVLVLYAHPRHDASQVNRRLRAAIENLPGVTLHDLYQTYPDFFIDARAEQELLLKHEVLVLQHPVYWYSTPAILKEWQDVVLEYGWAYGPGGTQLEGKYFMQALTAGGAQGDYRRGGPHGFSLQKFLRPFEQTAVFCRMQPLEPFVTYDARLIDPEGVDAQAARYRTAIENLVAGRMPALLDTTAKTG